jgi:hypothetical protein
MDQEREPGKEETTKTPEETGTGAGTTEGTGDKKEGEPSEN